MVKRKLEITNQKKKTPIRTEQKEKFYTVTTNEYRHRRQECQEYFLIKLKIEVARG